MRNQMRKIVENQMKNSKQQSGGLNEVQIELCRNHIKALRAERKQFKAVLDKVEISREDCRDRIRALSHDIFQMGKGLE